MDRGQESLSPARTSDPTQGTLGGMLKGVLCPQPPRLAQSGTPENLKVVRSSFPRKNVDTGAHLRQEDVRSSCRQPSLVSYPCDSNIFLTLIKGGELRRNAIGRTSSIGFNSPSSVSPPLREGGELRRRNVYKKKGTGYPCPPSMIPSAQRPALSTQHSAPKLTPPPNGSRSPPSRISVLQRRTWS